MQIDITKLLNNSIYSQKIDSTVTIPYELYKDSLIDNLKDIHLKGTISFDEDYNLTINASLKGIMTLKDDLTLSPVDYNFQTELEEILDKNKNILDITDVLWQNILVEIPSKVRSTDEDIELSGDGWRVISEDTFNNIRNNQNNPFANLDNLLKTKEEE